MLTGQELALKMSATGSVRRSTLALMAEEWAQHVGRAIRARRKELDMGPTEFSHAMNAALKTIERWERGETDGALRQLDHVARVLKTTPAELIALASVGDNGDEEAKGETPDLSSGGSHSTTSSARSMISRRGSTASTSRRCSRSWRPLPKVAPAQNAVEATGEPEQHAAPVGRRVQPRRALLDCGPDLHEDLVLDRIRRGCRRDCRRRHGRSPDAEMAGSGRLTSPDRVNTSAPPERSDSHTHWSRSIDLDSVQ